MARLILLNGPPASGKSSIALRYVDDHPLALDLDVDIIRSLLGNWRENLTEAGLIARRLALVTASEHLEAGHDVVVPQCVTRPAFIEGLERVAAVTDAEFHELVLLAPPAVLVERWSRRHRHGQSGVETIDSDPRAVIELYERLLLALRSRPRAAAIDTEGAAPDQVYAAVLAALGETSPPTVDERSQSHH
jgi:predicted kinase